MNLLFFHANAMFDLKVSLEGDVSSLTSVEWEIWDPTLVLLKDAGITVPSIFSKPLGSTTSIFVIEVPQISEEYSGFLKVRGDLGGGLFTPWFQEEITVEEGWEFYASLPLELPLSGDVNISLSHRGPEALTSVTHFLSSSGDPLEENARYFQFDTLNATYALDVSILPTSGECYIHAHLFTVGNSTWISVPLGDLSTWRVNYPTVVYVCNTSEVSFEVSPPRGVSLTSAVGSFLSPKGSTTQDIMTPVSCEAFGIGEVKGVLNFNGGEYLYPVEFNVLRGVDIFFESIHRDSEGDTCAHLSVISVNPLSQHLSTSWSILNSEGVEVLSLPSSSNLRDIKSTLPPGKYTFRASTAWEGGYLSPWVSDIRDLNGLTLTVSTPPQVDVNQNCPLEIIASSEVQSIELFVGAYSDFRTIHNPLYSYTGSPTGVELPPNTFPMGVGNYYILCRGVSMLGSTGEWYAHPVAISTKLKWVESFGRVTVSPINFTFNSSDTYSFSTLTTGVTFESERIGTNMELRFHRPIGGYVMAQVSYNGPQAPLNNSFFFGLNASIVSLNTSTSKGQNPTISYDDLGTFYGIIQVNNTEFTEAWENHVVCTSPDTEVSLSRLTTSQLKVKLLRPKVSGVFEGTTIRVVVPEAATTSGVLLKGSLVYTLKGDVVLLEGTDLLSATTSIYVDPSVSDPSVYTRELSLVVSSTLGLNNSCDVPLLGLPSWASSTYLYTSKTSASLVIRGEIADLLNTWEGIITINPQMFMCTVTTPLQFNTFFTPSDSLLVTPDSIVFTQGVAGWEPRITVLQVQSPVNFSSQVSVSTTALGLEILEATPLENKVTVVLGGYLAEVPETISLTFTPESFVSSAPLSVSLACISLQNTIYGNSLQLTGNSLELLTTPVSLRLLSENSELKFVTSPAFYALNLPEGVQLYGSVGDSGKEIQVFAEVPKNTDQEALRHRQILLEFPPHCFTADPNLASSYVPLVLHREEVSLPSITFFEFNMRPDSSGVSFVQSTTFRGSIFRDGTIESGLEAKLLGDYFTKKTFEVDVLTDKLKYVSLSKVPPGMKLRVYPITLSSVKVLLEGSNIDQVDVSDMVLEFQKECFGTYLPVDISNSTISCNLDFSPPREFMIETSGAIIESSVPGTFEGAVILSLETICEKAFSYCLLPNGCQLLASTPGVEMNGYSVEFVRTATRAEGFINNLATKLISKFYGPIGNTYKVKVIHSLLNQMSVPTKQQALVGSEILAVCRDEAILPPGFTLEITRQGVTNAILEVGALTLTVKHLHGSLGNNYFLKVVLGATEDFVEVGESCIWVSRIASTFVASELLFYLDSYSHLVTYEGTSFSEIPAGEYFFEHGKHTFSSEQLRIDINSSIIRLDLGVIPKVTDAQLNELFEEAPIAFRGTGEFLNLGTYAFWREVLIEWDTVFNPEAITGAIEIQGTYLYQGECTLSGGAVGDSYSPCFHQEESKITIDLGIVDKLAIEELLSIPPNPLYAELNSPSITKIRVYGKGHYFTTPEELTLGGGGILDNMLYALTFNGLGVLESSSYTTGGLPEGVTPLIQVLRAGYTEVDTYEDLPSVGSEGVKYLVSSTLRAFSWYASQYIEESPKGVLTLTGSTAIFNDFNIVLGLLPSAIRNPSMDMLGVEPLSIHVDMHSTPLKLRVYPPYYQRFSGGGTLPFVISGDTVILREANMELPGVYKYMRYFDRAFRIKISNPLVTFDDLPNFQLSPPVSGIELTCTRESDTSCLVFVRGFRKNKTDDAPDISVLRMSLKGKSEHISSLQEITIRLEYKAGINRASVEAYTVVPRKKKILKFEEGATFKSDDLPTNTTLKGGQRVPGNFVGNNGRYEKISVTYDSVGEVVLECAVVKSSAIRYNDLEGSYMEKFSFVTVGGVQIGPTSPLGESPYTTKLMTPGGYFYTSAQLVLPNVYVSKEYGDTRVVGSYSGLGEWSKNIRYFATPKSERWGTEGGGTDLDTIEGFGPPNVRPPFSLSEDVVPPENPDAVVRYRERDLSEFAEVEIADGITVSSLKKGDGDPIRIEIKRTDSEFGGAQITTNMELRKIVVDLGRTALTWHMVQEKWVSPLARINVTKSGSAIEGVWQIPAGVTASTYDSLVCFNSGGSVVLLDTVVTLLPFPSSPYERKVYGVSEGKCVEITLRGITAEHPLPRAWSITESKVSLRRILRANHTEWGPRIDPATGERGIEVLQVFCSEVTSLPTGEDVLRVLGTSEEDVNLLLNDSLVDVPGRYRGTYNRKWKGRIMGVRTWGYFDEVFLEVPPEEIPWDAVETYQYGILKKNSYQKPPQKLKIVYPDTSPSKYLSKYTPSRGTTSVKFSAFNRVKFKDEAMEEIRKFLIEYPFADEAKFADKRMQEYEAYIDAGNSEWSANNNYPEPAQRVAAARRASDAALMVSAAETYSGILQKYRKVEKALEYVGDLLNQMYYTPYLKDLQENIEYFQDKGMLPDSRK